MIRISYQQGEVSLLSAIAAAKMMIQYKAVDTQCVIEQRSVNTLVTVTLIVCKDGSVAEDIVAVPRAELLSS